LVAERTALVEASVAEIVGERVETSANDLILQAVERQDASNVDTAPRISPFSLEGLDDHALERLLSALAVIAEQTGAELGVDTEKHQVTLRTVDPIGREIARQAALEVVDRRMQAAEVPSLIQKTRRSTQRKVMDVGERALWLMQIEGRPELAELVGTLHHRFSYGQNALLHCQETGHLCGVIAAELGLPQSMAREAGMLHDIGKAVDHDVEGVHAIIGGELLRVLGVDAGIVHAVKAHHFDEEPSTDLAMLTICADAISASRPGARRDTLATYLLRLEQLQTIATRHGGVDRAFPLQAGRELRVFVKASQIKDRDMPPLSAEIAREIESEMQYPGVIKVTVIRETTAMATAPAQLVPVRSAVAEHAGHHEADLEDDVDVSDDNGADEG
jgi:ribonuclease Y